MYYNIPINNYNDKYLQVYRSKPTNVDESVYSIKPLCSFIRWLYKGGYGKSSWG